MIIKNFYNKNQRGLTLIEMMVVVAILGIIILGLVTFFTGGTKSWVAGQSQLTAQRNARQAMDRMIREIREGERIKIGSVDDIVVVYIPALGSELAYDVTYYLDDTTIFRKKNSSTSNPLIDYVKSLQFEYFRKNGSQVCDPPYAYGALTNVRIVLEVDVDNDENPDITLNSKVNLRNHGLSD